jgi:tetratricopeptide (TPR) repeat protein
MGQHKKAAADFSEVVRLDRDGREAYLNRGVALLDGGDTDAAIADFTEAINRDRYTPFAAYCRRAEAFLKKGDLKAASQDADAALRVNPNYADAYRCRGRIREKMGQQAKAAADFAQAKRLGNLTK